MIDRLTPVILLAGCTIAQTYETNIGPLRVYYDDTNTYFTGPVVVDGFEVEPFPLPGSVVVTQPDGADLTYSLETRNAAEVAMRAYCKVQTGDDDLSSISYQNGRFSGLCAGAVF